MAKYFESFPVVEYNGEVMTNITRRSDIFKALKRNPNAFLSYSIVGDDRPEDVAYYYYGSVDYTWIVLIANDVIDPYEEWPMNQDAFNKYLIKKYENISGLEGIKVIEWTQDQTIEDNILYFENIENNDRINLTTWKMSSEMIEGFEAKEWRPIRYYDFEMELQNSKREIKLLNNIYLDQVIQDFERSMK